VVRAHVSCMVIECSGPTMVKKHLEGVFAKLGVETRTAAAGMAMSRIRQLHPQFEG